jgi:hypothetical protein
VVVGTSSALFTISTDDLPAAADTDGRGAGKGKFMREDKATVGAMRPPPISSKGVYVCCGRDCALGLRSWVPGGKGISLPLVPVLVGVGGQAVSSSARVVEVVVVAIVA